jgi:hypothetical protein
MELDRWRVFLSASAGLHCGLQMGALGGNGFLVGREGDGISGGLGLSHRRASADAAHTDAQSRYGRCLLDEAPFDHSG